jgi:hypothetical protein
MKNDIVLLVLLALFLTIRACPPNCTQCSTSSYCTKCADGYRVSGGLCEQCSDSICAQCPESPGTCTKCVPTNGLIDGKCYRCKIAYCSDCIDYTTTCIMCLPGYKMVNNYCYPASRA